MTDHGYSRTSTDGQDGAGQVHRLTQAGIPRDLIWLDQGVSGMKAAASRPEFARMNAQLSAGDTVVTPELSRIGRSVKDVLETIEGFEARGIRLRILDLALDTATPTGRMVVTVLAAVARLERDLTSQRTKSALAARKAAGMRLGAPPKLSAGQVASLARMRGQGVSVPDLMAAFGLSRASVYEYLRRAQVPAAG